MLPEAWRMYYDVEYSFYKVLMVHAPLWLDKQGSGTAAFFRLVSLVLGIQISSSSVLYPPLFHPPCYPPFSLP